MSDVKTYLQRHEHLLKQRQNWEDQWIDIAEYISPRKGYFFDRDANLGDTRHSSILDGLSTRALRILTAGLQAGLTSPSLFKRLLPTRQEWPVWNFGSTIARSTR